MALNNTTKQGFQREQTNRRDFVIHATAATTLTALQSGSRITNLGAEGAVVISLPTNCVGQKGIRFLFQVMAAQELTIDPGDLGSAFYTTSKATDGQTATADAIGEWMEVVSDGNGDWITRSVGTWTIA